MLLPFRIFWLNGDSGSLIALDVVDSTYKNECPSWVILSLLQLTKYNLPLIDSLQAYAPFLMLDCEFRFHRDSHQSHYNFSTPRPLSLQVNTLSPR